MSITARITDLNTVRSALITAVNGKGGELSANATLYDILGGVENLPSGGSSPFDLVRITSYTEPQASLTAVSSIAISGMSDYSSYVGTYNVTAATERESVATKRIFKHSTDNKYLYWKDFYGTGYWVLADSLTVTEMYEVALYYSSDSALTSGTTTWYNDYGENQEVTAAVTTTTYPAVAFNLTGVKATEYNTSTHAWTFDNTSISFTSAERTPRVYGIYAAVGTAVIGDRIASYAGPMPTTGLVFYAPLDASHASAETGQTLNETGSVNYSGDALVLNGDGKITFDVGSSASIGTGPVTLSIWYKGTSDSGDMGAFLYGSTPYDTTVCAIKIDSGIAKITGWGSGSTALTAVTPVNDGSWHHIVVTCESNNAAIYIDGLIENSGSCSINIGGRDGVIGGTFWGDYSPLYGSLKAARIYNSVLSAQDIAALATEF